MRIVFARCLKLLDVFFPDTAGAVAFGDVDDGDTMMMLMWALHRDQLPVNGPRSCTS